MFKFVDEYRDKDLCRRLAEGIIGISKKPFTIMEVCGGHTMSIRKNGIHKLIGSNIKLVSGPGCPVCVTSQKDIDKAIALARLNNVVVCTFGDMVDVPGTSVTLAEVKAEKGNVRVVYSVQDVLSFAKNEPDKHFVFIGIGFETTAPTIAAAIMQAKAEKIKNFSVLALNKTMPAALKAVLEDKDAKINALISPGHVSTITGTGIYKFIVDDLRISCCVAGFEPADILRAIYLLAELRENNKVSLINAYERAVKENGNEKAKYIMYEVFDSADAEWRGFGVIPASGLRIRKEFADLDAEKIFKIDVGASKEIKGCICGDILRGIKEPKNCKLFGQKCTPMKPQGACMVSSEGTCAAWYKYGE
ncbi:MAG: hydrogenase formation protein HypD [Candidatus Omnitrophica bacterium]|nr:hydrogenase formation protein HypD [Candidatus Omnitrophota bacterium]